VRGRLQALLCLSLVGCTCDRDLPPLDPDLGVVRPATPPVPPGQEPLTYRVGDGSALTFEIPAPGARIPGRVPVSGTVQIDLMDLRRTRATLTADLLGLEVTDAPVSVDDPARTAREWLGLGSGRATTERDARRHARFELHRVGRPSVAAAHAGRQTAWRAEGADAGEGEERAVDLVATGDLTLNARRATLDVTLGARFRYPAPALSGARPDQILLETTRPLTLERSVFDVQPRDAQGTLLAAEVSAARKALGPTILISARLLLIPAVEGEAGGWRAGETP
jgi:hypothetical protein